MASPVAIPKFIHRFNNDGTIDTVCRVCFITVATRTCESDLERLEHDHLCNPWMVARYKQHDQKRDINN